MSFKTKKSISSQFINSILLIFIFFICLLLFLSLSIYNTELGYINSNSDYLPLNLIRSINQFSIDNDNDLSTTPAIGGTCLYSKNKLLKAFNIRGVDLSQITFKTEKVFINNIFNIKCWDRASGASIEYFTPINELEIDQEIIIIYNQSPNPIIFLVLLILLLLLKKYHDYLITKYITYFNIYKRVKLIIYERFILIKLYNLSDVKKALIIISSFLASLSIYLQQSKMFKTYTFYIFAVIIFLIIFYKRNDDVYDIKIIFFIYSMVIFYFFERNINFLNLYMERDFYQSLKFIFRIQNEYQEGLVSNIYYINEIGGGQRLVGQFGNSYLPRVLIFKIIDNFNLALAFYFIGHLFLSALMFYIGLNKIFKDKFLALTSVFLYLFSNSFIEWYKITHFPPTILAFSFLIYSLGCVYKNEHNRKIFFSQFLGYLILFHSAHIQFLVYILGIINFFIVLIAISTKSMRFIYLNLSALIIALLSSLKPWILFFETFTFSSRITNKQSSIEFINFNDIWSIFNLDINQNLSIDGNSDFYFSFLSIFFVLIITKISFKNERVKILIIFTILSLILTTENILMKLLLDNISILNSISNYARLWIFCLFLLIILIVYIFLINLRPNKSSIFYLLSFLLSLNIVLKVDYYYGEKFNYENFKPKYLKSENLPDIYEEMKVLVEKNNEEEYKWSAICVSNTLQDIYYPNMGLVAERTQWFDAYDSWVTERYFNYFNLIRNKDIEYSNWSGYYTNFIDDKINLKLLEEANVKYLLSPKPTCQHSKQLKLIDESEHYFVYELNNPKELFEFATKGLKQIDFNKSNESIVDDIVSYEVVENVDNFIIKGDSQILNFEYLKSLQIYKLNVFIEGKNLLVFRNSYDPRWEVYIDGVKNQLLNIDLLFMGVLVKEGDYLIEFKFNDSIFR